MTQKTYIQSHFAEHSEEFSHDQINRLLRQRKLTPQTLRERIREKLVVSENDYILFDDTVIDKNHSFAIEAVHRQWSGNAKKVIKGVSIL